MRFRSLLVTGIIAAALVGSAVAGPAQAARKLQGSLRLPQAPAWLGLLASDTGMGSDTVTATAFANACRKDREAHAAGKAKDATNIAKFLKSGDNGLDAYVFDLGAETMGAFAAEGPGTKELVPATPVLSPIAEYDLDLDFFTGAEVDAAKYDQLAGGLGCPNANLVGSKHKCYAHKPDAHEKTGCVAGYKDAKKVLHGARYVMISGSMNIKGPMPVFLTAP